MLTVTYHLVSGRVSDIPNEPHQFRLYGWKQLTPYEQQAFKRFVIQQRLAVSLNQAVHCTTEETRKHVAQLQSFWRVHHQQRPRPLHRLLGWLCVFLMFAVPVYVAYHFSDWLQSEFVAPWIDSVAQHALFRPSLIHAFLFGDYGVLSLGTYSLVWALPVVVLLSLSTALIEQSHLKQYIIWSIAPTMGKVGLDATDIIPLLEGFGCNAAAIVQAGHQCHLCTRTRCMSLISFGTSCSYQIGATLSIFNVAHQTWLFIPYLLLVLVGGLLHNRLWYRTEQQFMPIQATLDESLTWPSLGRVLSQMGESVKMFLFQALPIFIAICLIASALALTPIMEMISKLFIPLLSLLHIPHELSPGILFSMIRKDGMLLFNIGDGQFIHNLSSWQVLLLVFFSSTFTACSVTMTMVMRQLGWREGGKMIARQMLTSLACVILLGSITWILLL
ncbi:nucleoside recognition domain-containing protein [Staphylococcus pseudintermedius]|uniref:nucleoside recognition domain-containing protein n=1 Tax=Staphylococcus pseudintermedius TaxID=283734 RepID=UPI0028FD03DE|nr:nucleoside recognition domain-containing protein [Staphylococcus pseudintermedius]MDU0382530.1 ferrous iron transporter B [Staphylococcus pseudintermedius]